MNVIAKHLYDIKYDPFTMTAEDGYKFIDFKIPEPPQPPKQRKRGSIKALKKKSRLTRGKLQKGMAGPWSDWQQSEFKQWDQYNNQGTFGPPQKLPHGANLLNMIWTYLIKDDGTKKARAVCNGSPKQQGTVTLAETYASALEQTGGRIFWAAAAIYNLIIIGADATNAFAEAPPPVAPLYVRVNQSYKEWYKERFPDRIQPADDDVLRVKGALQGHPESPRLWAVLYNKLQWNRTTSLIFTPS